MTMTDERLAELDAVSQTIHGEPFAETINKILCVYSAWVAMPNKDVAEKVAFAALVKATMITDCTDNATIDAQDATIARLRRCLLPVQMLMAQAECVDEPLSDSAVVLSFMGSGASDQVTAGEVRAALTGAA